MTDHPIKWATLVTYQRRDGLDGFGSPFIARFHPTDAWPIFFSGDTETEAIERAEKFRNETIEKHGAAYEKRQAALVAARAARKKKA